ncbi:hypothetical protein ACFYOT_30220 [Saccharothrix saharensis]|uniref:hypothetical protein n=1 Tax=Saccharothrix saharensis TaxID=571190 RepID=UPI003686EE06
MTRDDWVAEQSRGFASLLGRRVESWVGVEMALRENGTGGGPRFSDPEVPCLQLFGLQASLEDDGALSVTTYQDGTEFGLSACLEARFPADGEWDGIYRWRPLTELPLGRVGQVTVFSDEGVLAEVCLWIGARPLLLIAGELDETLDGGLLFHRLDESVLAFTDSGAAEQVPWTTSRRGLVRIDHGGEDVFSRESEW